MTLWLDDPATGIDPNAKRVAHGVGELAYDALIIATGATPIRPDLPGLDLPGVRVLHTYIYEQDPPFGDPTFDPFACAQAGFDYLDRGRF